MLKCRVSYITGRPTDIGLQMGRAAILVAGKGRGGMFLFICFFTSFLFLFLPCSSFSSLLLSLLSLFSLSLGDNTELTTRVDVSLNHNTINQIISKIKNREPWVPPSRSRTIFGTDMVNVPVSVVAPEFMYYQCILPQFSAWLVSNNQTPIIRCQINLGLTSITFM